MLTHTLAHTHTHTHTHTSLFSSTISPSVMAKSVFPRFCDRNSCCLRCSCWSLRSPWHQQWILLQSQFLATCQPAMTIHRVRWTRPESKRSVLTCLPVTTMCSPAWCFGWQTIPLVNHNLLSSCVMMSAARMQAPLFWPVSTRLLLWVLAALTTRSQPPHHQSLCRRAQNTGCGSQLAACS